MDQAPHDSPGTSRNRDLGAEVEKWKIGITAVAAALIGAYFVYFPLVVKLDAALDPDKWGTFGDFFGGIMNPVVAFAAFYWLTRSVKLQKEELAETRHELKEAASAQKALVANGSVQVQLAALTALANAASNEMTVASADVMSLRAPRAGASETAAMLFRAEDNPAYLKALATFGIAKQRRDNYLAQMEVILSAHSPSALSHDETPESRHAEAVSGPDQRNAAGPSIP